MSVRKENDKEVTEVAQTERIGLGDLVVAGAIAAVAYLLSTLWQNPTPPPSMWENLSIASGVRPAASVMPGYWQLVGSAVFGFLGPYSSQVMLQLMAHLSFGLIGLCVYGTLRELFFLARRSRPQYSRRRTFVMRISAAVGTVAFLCSDPVWAAGQFFTETTIQLLLTVGAVGTFFLYVRKSSLFYGYICTALLGLLAAETIVGVVFVALFLIGNSIILKLTPGGGLSDFGSAAIGGKWYMTFLFLVAFAAGVLANCWGYVHLSGLAANGGTIGDLPLRYLLGYWAQGRSMTGTLGWILFAGAALAPFLVTLIHYPGASDEERMLPYATGIAFLFCGIVAASQSVGIPALWYWKYGAVNSDYLLTLGAFFSAAAVAAAVSILGIDALCRNSRRLARHILGVEGTDAEDAEVEKSIGSGHRLYVQCAMLALVPLVLAAAMLPGRVKRGTRAMMALVDEAVRAIVEEAGDAKWLFTDGNLDPAIELWSRRCARELNCVSVISGGSPRDQLLRTRGLGGDAEDLFSFRHNGGMGLRSWMRDKPERLAQSAVQIGFDLWKRDGRAIPEMGGFLSRPGVKADPEKTAAFIARAHDLAKRMLELRAKGAMSGCTDASVRTAYNSVMWRLARMCAYRGERYDLAGRAEESIAEVKLSKELNDGNEIYQQLVANAKKHNEQLMKRLTPREGLQLALVRADFTMAKLYAESILENEPEHGDANFAMGMFYLKGRQLSRAEEYFKRCLIHKPKEAAIYNNLAMLQAELGKFDAALVNVEKAAALLPESDVVKDTRKFILDQRDGKAKGAAEKKGGAS